MYSSSSIDSPGCQVVQLQARHSFHSIPQHRRLLLQRCCNSRLRSTVIPLMAGWLRSGFPVHGLGSYPNTHTYLTYILYMYTHTCYIYIYIYIYYTVCILGSRIPQLNIKQQGLWTLRRAHTDFMSWFGIPIGGPKINQQMQQTSKQQKSGSGWWETSHNMP